MPVLFQIPVLPRSTGRTEGNVATSQVERSEASLAGGIQMQAAKMNTAFPQPHRSLTPDLVALEGRPFLPGRWKSPAPRSTPWEAAEETKASGLVV